MLSSLSFPTFLFIILFAAFPSTNALSDVTTYCTMKAEDGTKDIIMDMPVFRGVWEYAESANHAQKPLSELCEYRRGQGEAAADFLLKGAEKESRQTCKSLSRPKKFNPEVGLDYNDSTPVDPELGQVFRFHSKDEDTVEFQAKYGVVIDGPSYKNEKCSFKKEASQGEYTRVGDLMDALKGHYAKVGGHRVVDA